MLETLAAGRFASSGINSLGAGLFHGNPAQLGIQAGAIVYVTVVTLARLKLVDTFAAPCVDADHGVKGLDLTRHRESGCTILD